MSSLRHASGVVTRRVAGRIVVLPPDEDHPMVLSAVGAIVWDALEQPTTETALVARLAATFDVDDAQVAQDVEPFVEQLAAAGVVVTE